MKRQKKTVHDFAYLKRFKYLKLDETVPETRFVIVMAENSMYIQGIDLKYLPLGLAHDCLKEIVDEYIIREPEFPPEMSLNDKVVIGFRVFRKDRIVG